MRTTIVLHSPLLSHLPNLSSPFLSCLLSSLSLASPLLFSPTYNSSPHLACLRSDLQLISSPRLSPLLPCLLPVLSSTLPSSPIIHSYPLLLLSCPHLSSSFHSPPLTLYPILSFPLPSSHVLSSPLHSPPLMLKPFLSFPLPSSPLHSPPLMSYPFLSLPLPSSHILSFPLLSSPLLSSHIFALSSYLLLSCPCLYCLDLPLPRNKP
jgi:hypothetical protein